MRRGTRAILSGALATVLAAGCNSDSRLNRPAVVNGGDRQRGAALIRDLGCGACHTVPGVKDAKALVGPPLNHFGSRSFIAGQLANTPDNLARWIIDPQSVEPGTAMPNLNVTPQQARDIVAYLEGL